MKKIHLLVLSLVVLCTCGALQAQKLNNVWYFGYNAGLDFNSGTPVAVYNNAMMAGEGSACISDNNGSLLFYTDGISIWNRSNTKMPNGTGLTGDPQQSSTQCALIVPKPGSTNLYYVFVTYSGLYYSIVDMNLNGGLGDIVSGKKNIKLIGSSGEKICGTPHANGTDVWVMVNEFSTNGFNAFLVTDTGVVTTAVHSNSGLSNSQNGLYGQMKFTCKGDKIAFGIADQSDNLNNTVFIGDFNNSTGVVSNGYNLKTYMFQTYGVEFSPNGRYLYTAINYTVVQYDLNAGSQSLVQASADTVLKTGPVDGLQLGPDNKLYCGMGGSSLMSVINKPDLGGSACNVSVNTVSLGGHTIGLDFPSIINYQCATTQTIPLVVADTFSNATCHDSCNGRAALTITNGKAPYHILWSSGDTTAAISNLCAGSYTVHVTDQASSNFTDTIVITSAPAIQVNITAPRTTFCSSDTVMISATAGFKRYAWNSSGNDSIIQATHTGHYSVLVTDSMGCKKESNQLAITINTAPDISFSGKNIFCAGDSIHVCVTANYKSYLWSSGQTTACVEINSPGDYYVTVTDANNCIGKSYPVPFTANIHPVSSIALIVRGDTLSSYGANSYSWYLNNTVMPQANSAVLIAAVSGQYEVGIVDTNGCTVISSPVNVTVTTTGITDFKETHFDVYPNPFNGEIHFTSNTPLQFTIYNDLGQTIKTGIAERVIETSELIPGIYLLLLKDNNNSSTLRMIKN